MRSWGEGRRGSRLNLEAFQPLVDGLTTLDSPEITCRPVDARVSLSSLSRTVSGGEAQLIRGQAGIQERKKSTFELSEVIAQE